MFWWYASSALNPDTALNRLADEWKAPDLVTQNSITPHFQLTRCGWVARSSQRNCLLFSGMRFRRVMYHKRRHSRDILGTCRGRWSSSGVLHYRPTRTREIPRVTLTRRMVSSRNVNAGASLAPTAGVRRKVQLVPGLSMRSSLSRSPQGFKRDWTSSGILHTLA